MPSSSFFYKLCFVIIVVLLVTQSIKDNTKSVPDSALDLFNWIIDSIGGIAWEDMVEVVQDTTGLVFMCPYRPNVLQTLQKELEHSIVDQQFGVEIIMSATRVWEFSRDNIDNHSPLVLAISGPTGVGKSESAYVIAKSFLKKQFRYGYRYMPLGAHIFNGKDFTSTQSADIERNADRLAFEVGSRIDGCGGTSVIIFDEVQKFAPGTLNRILPALKERGVLTYETNRPWYSSSSSLPLTKTVSTQNCIFIFVTDVGKSELVRVLLQYEKREDIPQTIIRTAVREAMSVVPSLSELASTVDEVVPFLPLEKKHMKNVLKVKLEQESVRYKDIRWRSLIVDDNVLQHMVSNGAITYKNYTTKVMTATGTKETRTRTFADAGARALDKMGPLGDLKDRIEDFAQPYKPGRILRVDPLYLDEAQAQAEGGTGSSSSDSVDDHEDAIVVNTSDDEIKNDSSSSGSSSGSGETAGISLKWCTQQPPGTSSSSSFEKTDDIDTFNESDSSSSSSSSSSGNVCEDPHLCILEAICIEVYQGGLSRGAQGWFSSLTSS